jgi:hypothetical protein
VTTLYPRTSKPIPITPALTATAHHAIDLEGMMAGDYVTIGGHWYGLQSVDTHGTANFAPHPAPECGTVSYGATHMSLQLLHCPWLGCAAVTEPDGSDD